MPEPAGFDTERANSARMYDYWLGGAHNFGVDREHADLIERSNRNAKHAARSNRAYLARVVRACLARGIDQFLDLGSGVPTVGNVHEVCARLNPAARVAYVDAEPVAVAHSREILAGSATATVTHADLRDHDAVLDAPGVAGLLDFSRPVAVLAIAVLHFVPGDLLELLGPYRERLVPGGVIALSHVTDDLDDEELVSRIRAATTAFGYSSNPVTLRTQAELLALYDGMTLLAPGLVDIVDWPAPAAPEVEKIGILAAVGVLPEG